MAFAFPNDRKIKLTFANSGAEAVKAELLNAGAVVSGITLAVQNNNEVELNAADNLLPASATLSVRIQNETNPARVSISSEFEFFENVRPAPPTVPTQNDFLVHLAAAGEVYATNGKASDGSLSWLKEADSAYSSVALMRNQSGYAVGNVDVDGKSFSTGGGQLFRNLQNKLYVETSNSDGYVFKLGAGVSGVPNPGAGFHYFMSFVVPDLPSIVGSNDTTAQHYSLHNDQSGSVHHIRLRQSYLGDANGVASLSDSAITMGSGVAVLSNSLTPGSNVILEVIVPDTGDCTVRVHHTQQETVSINVTNTRLYPATGKVFATGMRWYAVSIVKNHLAGTLSSYREELLQWHKTLSGTLGQVTLRTEGVTNAGS